ncbi:MAG TPA: type III pantothenate kinase, partial [Candidatus Acidoferrales bacterium]|nr:type III pantothenate kinase [Candidatus Acidoferrales bacterium]
MLVASFASPVSSPHLWAPHRRMLLAIDCGNSEFKLGLFEAERLVADWRLTTRPDQTADELGALLRQLFELRGVDLAAVDGVVIASVVPSFNRALIEASQTYLKQEPLMVGPGIKTGVRVRIENPKEVGADRIANSLAAFRRYGGPVVVIDIGTALTYDAVSAEGDYLGGAIAPGLTVAMDA